MNLSKRKMALGLLSLAVGIVVSEARELRNLPSGSAGIGQLMLEHAEILVSGQSGIVEAYLTIWNGTDERRRIVSITSDAFSEASVLRPIGRDQQPEMKTVDTLSIPAHAELKMQANRLRLRLIDFQASAGTALNPRVKVTFEGGTTLELPVKIFSEGSLLTDHHHGLGDIS